MKALSTYIDQATGVEVKVYPSQEAPKRKTPKKRKSAVIQQSMVSGMNAYDAAVQLDVQYEAPEIDLDKDAMVAFEEAVTSARNSHRRSGLVRRYS